MPTYVYRRADGTTFEHFQRITDDALTVDPETGQPVSRLISGGAGLQFKGTGFYETDYVKKSGAPKSESDAPAKASTKKASKAADTSSASSSTSGASTSTDD